MNLTYNMSRVEILIRNGLKVGSMGPKTAATKIKIGR